MPKKNIDFGFTPSEYQQKFFDWVQHGTGNAVLNAYAGSAKTSTMVAAIKLIPKTRKILVIAFNKSIVEELQEKLKEFPNCTIMTVHSLGSSIIRRNFGYRMELDEYKYRNHLKNNFCELSQIDCETIDRNAFEDYVDTCTDLIKFSRYYLRQSVSEIKGIADRFNYPIQHDECEVVKKCLDWGKKHLERIDYADMVWLPYELGLSPQGNQFDWVFFDEAQDASMAYFDLFKRVQKRGTRCVCAGDIFQSINGFAGAATEVFEKIMNEPNTQIFDLPICYRCDKAIIEQAQTLVPGIQLRDGAGDGQFTDLCHLSEIQPGDLILSRYKAPLLRLYFWLIKRGMNCYVKGSDIGTNLLDRINSVEATVIGKDMSDPNGLLIQLYRRLIDLRNHIMVSHSLDIWDADLSVPVMSFYDEITVLIAIAEKCETIEELKDRITLIFKDDSEGICLSTIHKAKGLEADNVYIICRSTMPPKRAKEPWEIQQEMNLIYVAITRPRHKLGFIDEKEVPPAGSAQTDDKIVNDIAAIEKRVCNVFGIPMSEDSNSTQFAKFRLKAATNIEDRHANDNVIYINNENEASEEEASLDDLLLILD